MPGFVAGGIFQGVIDYNMPANLLKIAKESAGAGDYTKALEAVNSAIEINPSLAGAWFLKATILRSLGRLEEAIESLEKALKFNPSMDKALCEKGAILLDLNSPREALIFLEWATMVNPSNACAFRITGDTYYKLKRKREAITAYKKAIELGDQDAAQALKDCMSKMEMYEKLIFGDLVGPDDQSPKSSES